MAVSLQKFSYFKGGKLLNLNSWLAVQRYIRKEKTGMKVYCVITETDQGIDLSCVYWNLESAVEHVKRRDVYKRQVIYCSMYITSRRKRG